MYETLNMEYMVSNLSSITNASIITIIILVILMFNPFVVSSTDHRSILEEGRQGSVLDSMKIRVLRKLLMQEQLNHVTSVNHRKNIYNHWYTLDREESLYLYNNQDKLKDYGYVIVNSRVHERARVQGRRGTRPVHSSNNLRWYIWESFPLN